MSILIKSELFTPEGIAKIEAMKKAVYVCETCLQDVNHNWVNNPVAVFYNLDPANVPEGGSRWFGMFWRVTTGLRAEDGHQLFITNAISAVANPIIGVQAENGDIIYSRYRWDYRTSPDGSVWIDGGRDYTRWGGSGKLVMLGIREGGLVVTGDDHDIDTR